MVKSAHSRAACTPMILMPHSLAVRHPAELRATLKREIEALDAACLPLDQALARSSHVSAAHAGATILRVEDMPDTLRVKAGLFFTGIIAGCSCADDPTPIDEIAEYCEVWFEIDRATAQATVSLVREDDAD